MPASPRVLLLAATFLIVRGASAVAQSPAGPPISYPDALRRVLESHESLQAADKEIQQREEERSATKSLYWPKVDASIRGTSLDGPIDIDLSPIRQAILALHPQVPASLVPPFVERVQDSRFWLADIKVTWPIYTGGKVPAAKV